MRKSKKRAVSLLALGMLALTLTVVLTGAKYSFPEKWNDLIRDLDSRMNQFNEVMPQERVYLQLDKPFYKPGEDIWFSAYLREGTKLTPSFKSDILHVELINPKGNVEKEIRLIASKGKAAGDFHIDEMMPGGIYKIKAWTQWQKNREQAPVFEKEFQVQKVVLPRLKMKLDFDRKAFGPGDEVVATLELETNANEPLANHDFRLTANLAGSPIHAAASKTGSDGEAKLKFNLPADLETSDGLLNIMINYNGLTESISRSIPIVLNQIEMEFFPEGGDLVEAMTSKVAFRALNEFGKPADIEGRIRDSRGNEVATFSSFHQGMGSFAFLPERGEQYHAEITRPEGISRKYELPSPVSKGFVLTVEDQQEDLLKVNILSSDISKASLVAQVRGKLHWASEVNLQPGNNIIRIPADRLPVGVAQLTLFDAKGIARAERLAFVNRDKGMKVAIRTNKEQYLPREKVRMEVSVTDDRGWPIPAQLSLAVVNDQLLSFADDKSGNILSKMLLEYDLSGEVEEPAFYFDQTEEKAEKALDLLLMTAGWRRFTWAEIVSGTQPSVSYPAEKTLIEGMVYDAWTGEQLSGVRLHGKDWGVTTNSEGKFSIHGIDLSEAKTGTIEKSGYLDQTVSFSAYGEGYALYLSPNQQRTRQGWLEDMPVPAEMEVFDADIEEEDAAGFGRGMEPAMDFDQNAPVAMPQKFQAEDLKRVNFAQPSNNGLVPGNAKPTGGMELGVKELEKSADKKDDFRRNAQEVRPDDGDIGLASGIETIGEIQEKNELKTIVVADEMNADGFLMRWDNNRQQVAAQQVAFYRAREFAAPVYDRQGEGEAPGPEMRNDFRSTLFWEPNLMVGRSGKAVVEFYTSDEITSFKTIVEGIGQSGEVGRGEANIFTQLPFSMDAKAPVEVALNDRMSIPVVLTNNTDRTLTGAFQVTAPSGLRAVRTLPGTVSVPAGQTQTLHLEYEAIEAVGKEDLEISFSSQGRKDAFRKEIEIVPQGYPVNISFSGREPEANYQFRINRPVDGSIRAKFNAYPSVVSDLLKGIESILQEPYGCFEQTSSSSYPNVLVMNYLEEMEVNDPAIRARATDLLERGYARLTTFETPVKGYEWFGSTPPHEGLSAYGLMQFNEMKHHSSKVDQSMIDRTAEWLLSRRDGKGTFQVSDRFLHSWLTDVEITSAYCVFALSEAGYGDGIATELSRAAATAKQSGDPYQLALTANAMFNVGRTTEGKALVAQLAGTQAKDGSFTGKKFSVVCSKGQSLAVETTGLAIQAMIKGKQHHAELLKAVDFLLSQRNGNGGFGNTQATVLALKALTEFAAFSKKTDEAGTVEVWVDGKKAGDFEFEKGRKDEIEISGLEVYLSEGEHTVEVRYPGVKSALPWSVDIAYYTNQPIADEACQVRLDTRVAAKTAKVGETLRLNASLRNTSDEGVASPMAVIGIPAGLSAQPWQLKEMQEKGVFDYYELIGNKLVCYYRDLKPREVREINLDLKAEIPGAFEAPASLAYLYYTPEHKYWTSLPAIQVEN